jgi:hypothetical protein
MPKIIGLSADNDNRPRRAAVIHPFFCACHDCSDLNAPVARATDLWWAAAWSFAFVLSLILVLALHALWELFA